ncbi:type VI secretion system tip protein VgrG [Draconibacterium sp.]|nr:type VI secretion system tip protein VgrG [Draconibacterium sp.]
MTEERVIPNRGSTEQPRFEVLVDNERLPLETPIHALHVWKEFNRISGARIILLDGDASEEDFEWSSSDYLEPGKEIEIKAGYDQGTETIFKGIIVTHKIKIRAYADPWLTIECRDKAYKMSLGRKNRYYFDMPDSDIIDQILQEYSITGEITDTAFTHKQMVQYQSTDWDFMVMRAEANGMFVLPDDGTLKMVNPDVSAEAEFSVLFGASMIEFDGELDARIQSEKTEAIGWDYASQDISSVENGTITEAGISNNSSTQLAQSTGYETNSIRNSGLNDDAELQLLADGKQNRIANTKIRGRAKFTGNPTVKPGVVLDLQGLGRRMNGSTIVWGVRHEFENGVWTTNAVLGTKEKFFHEENKISESQASGLLPPVHGLEIGKVTALEGDPDNEYRIRVKVPILDNEDEGVWARICTLDAGVYRGTFFRPEIDDEVIVGYINDDPRNAIVLGMLNSSAKSAPSENSDDNHEKGLVTRSGMKVWFDDDKVDMVLETPNGNSITLSDNDGKITIEDENGNTGVFDSSGISFDSPNDISITAQGDITLEGMNVTVNANAQLKASGSAGAELSSGAATIIQGSIIQIN